MKGALRLHHYQLVSVECDEHSNKSNENVLLKILLKIPKLTFCFKLWRT